MKLFGFQIGRTKAAPTQTVDTNRGWVPLIRESYAGSWQQGVAITPETALAHSAVFASVSLIASDIGKLPVKFTKLNGGIWSETATGHEALMRKPNPYQNRAQFFGQWVTSKLLWGACYVLKRRDARGQIVALTILDPQRVQPLIANDGSIFYRVSGADALTGIPPEGLTIPAREVIHDRGFTPWHPLVGVSPLTAAALSAGQGLAIQKNSESFFRNASNPGGILTAPGAISPETAQHLKDAWQAGYTGENSGKVAVVGDGLKYEAIGVAPVDAQLIEQLRWTGEDVCRAFRVPGFKVGVGPAPSYNSATILQEIYLSDALQAHIESIELCLDEGLALAPDTRTELDEGVLLRMDAATRFKTYSDAIGGGWMAPNEARRREGLPPVEGGDSPLMQQQNYSLAALARRDQQEGAPA